MTKYYYMVTYLEHSLAHGLLHTHFDSLAILSQYIGYLTHHLEQGADAIYIHLRVQLWDGAPVKCQAAYVQWMMRWHKGDVGQQ